MLKQRKRGIDVNVNLLSVAIVHLDRLRHNYEIIEKATTKGTGIIPVIKADAYGHGMLRVAKALEDYSSIAYLAVAHAREGIDLRKSGITKGILILSCFDSGDIEQMYRFGLTPVIHSIEILKQVGECARALGLRIPVHLKFDTGMARLGINPMDAERALELVIDYSSSLQLDGLMSHFSDSESDAEWTQRQNRLFNQIVDLFNSRGLEPRYRHIANTGAIFLHKNTHHNCIRPGLALYGYLPHRQLKNIVDLKPVLEVKSQLISIHQLKAGEGISYGRSFVADKDMRVGVVAFGYADGLFRSLSNKMECIVNGKRCKGIGTICMDMFMCDLTDIDASVYDTVTIIGSDGSESITADELAEKAGTINYEILTNIAKSDRIKRIYRGD